MGADATKNKEDRVFPNPEDFESYDEVDSEDGQAELSADSFSEILATEDECGCN